MEFKKENFDLFRKEIKAALRAIEEKFDIQITLGNINYNDISFTSKLEVKRMDIDTDKIEWQRICCLFGLEVDDYNSIIRIKGKDYKLVGINSKKSKFPIIAESIVSQERICITNDAVLELLKK